MNLTHIKKILSCFLFVTLFFIITSGPINSQEVKTICIVPFDTNSQQDISYIKSGIINMLDARLTWKNKVLVTPKSQTKTVLSEIKKSNTKPSIIKIGKAAKADYVITGIITEFSGAFSVDTKVYDLEKKSYLTFFGQSKDINTIIPQIDIIAAKINKKVFDRTTVSYERFEKDKIITEEELRRMNPEKMMPVVRPEDQEDEPWWKLW